MEEKCFQVSSVQATNLVTAYCLSMVWKERLGVCRRMQVLFRFGSSLSSVAVVYWHCLRLFSLSLRAVFICTVLAVFIGTVFSFSLSSVAVVCWHCLQLFSVFSGYGLLALSSALLSVFKSCVYLHCLGCVYWHCLQLFSVFSSCGLLALSSAFLCLQ